MMFKEERVFFPKSFWVPPQCLTMTPRTCEDGSFYCIPPRNTVILISILSMVVGLIDLISLKCSQHCCTMKDYVESMRYVLAWLFQLANMLLLASSFIQNALLASIYVWYTLGYIVMGLCVAILDLMIQFSHDGAQGLVGFATETVFLFVISRCLPLVNSYRQYLSELAALNTYQ